MGFRVNSARSLLVLVAVVVTAAVLGGCYTVLKHPRTDVTAEGAAGAGVPLEGLAQVDFAHQDCYSCHRVDGPAHAYDPLAAPAFSYYDDALYGYYAFPWWHREYWESDDYGYGGGWRDSLGFRTPVDDDSRRNLWRRGGESPSYLPPPIFGGQPGGGAGGAAPGGTTGTSEPTPTTQEGRTMKPGSTPVPPVVPPVPPAPPEKKKDDKKKDGKTDVWGRGGGHQ